MKITFRVDQEPLTSVSSGCWVSVLVAHMRQGVIRPYQRGTWVAGVAAWEGEEARRGGGGGRGGSC